MSNYPKIRRGSQSGFQSLAVETQLDVVEHLSGRDMARVTGVSKGLHSAAHGAHGRRIKTTIELTKLGLVSAQSDSKYDPPNIIADAQQWAKNWEMLKYQQSAGPYSIAYSGPATQWARGTGFPGRGGHVDTGIEQYVGSSGNYVFAVIGSPQHTKIPSLLRLYRLPSLRRGIPELKEDVVECYYRIRAVALNEAENLLVLLEYRRPKWIFHVHDLYNTKFRHSFSPPSSVNPPEEPYEQALRIEQFELCGTTLGFFAGRQVVMADVMQKVSYNCPLGSHNDRAVTEEVKLTGFYGFHFITPTSVLLASRCVHRPTQQKNWSGAVFDGFRYLNLQKGNHVSSSDAFFIMDNKYTDLDQRFTFLPNLSPTLQSRVIPKTAFIHDPSERVVTMKFDQNHVFSFKESLFYSEEIPRTYHAPTDVPLVNPTVWWKLSHDMQLGPAAEDLRNIGNRLFVTQGCQRTYQGYLMPTEYEVMAIEYNKHDTPKKNELMNHTVPSKSSAKVHAQWNVVNTVRHKSLPKTSTGIIDSCQTMLSFPVADRIIVTEDNIVLFYKATAASSNAPQHPVKFAVFSF